MIENIGVKFWLAFSELAHLILLKFVDSKAKCSPEHFLSWKITCFVIWTSLLYIGYNINIYK